MAGTVLRIVVAIAFGYLVGGIPFGVIVARGIYKVDLTKTGSGATGGTNVLRTLGWKAAAPVMALDILKGTLAAAVALWLTVGSGWGQDARDLLVIAGGASAMLGHIYSPFNKLRGGKGVATGAGALVVLMPLVLLPCLVGFLVAVFLTRRNSVGSLTAAVILPVAGWLLYPGRGVLLGFSIGAVLLVFWAHRANIGRLMRGEEPRTTIGSTKKDGREGEDDTR